MPNSGCLVNVSVYWATLDGQKNDSGLLVSVIKRQLGSRRRYTPVQFPLTDSRGAFVTHDRRQLPERRKRRNGLEDLKTVLSKIYSD